MAELTKQQIQDQLNALTVDGDTLSANDTNYLINYMLANGDLSGTPRDLIQVRRGNVANLPNLAQGELAVTLDTEELYFGGTAGNVSVSNSSRLQEIEKVVHNGNVTIYVDVANGSDTNKGDTAENAVQTIAKAIQLAPAIVRGGDFEDITIELAAGTYKESIKLIGYPLSLGTRIWFKGKVDGANVPTVILDCENTRTYGVQAQKGISFLLQDMKVINIPNGGYGVTASQWCEPYLWNVHVNGQGSTGVTGIIAEGNCRLYTRSCRVENCSIGIEGISSSTVTMGYAGNGDTVIGCTDAGVLLQECTTGHVDRTTIQNCNYGLRLTVMSRSNSSNLNISGCTKGIGVHHSSRIYMNAGNTLTGNTKDFEYNGYSGRYNADGSQWVPLETYEGSLPVAQANYRGVVACFKSDTVGIADAAYVCLKNTAGNWEWVRIAVGS